jgi:hypothetical protein
MKHSMTLQDIIQFVGRNEDRWLPTIGGRAQFRVRSAGSKAFAFTIEPGTTRNESHDSIERSLEIFNETGSFKTTTYQHITFKSSYLLRLFFEIAAERNGIKDVPPDLPIEEMEILAAEKMEQLELRRSRLGQGRFREGLIRLRKCCYISGLSETGVLRASHIKSWKDSNNPERLDPHNGLLLTPNYDALFDSGFISFTDEGRILLSNELPSEVVRSFAVDPDFKGHDLGSRTKRYLAYHREHHFRGSVAFCEVAKIEGKH